MPDPNQPDAGTLSIAMSTAAGDVYQVIRRPDGTWMPAQLVFQHTSSRNAVGAVDIQDNSQGGGVFARYRSTGILQLIRPHFGGGWEPPKPIPGASGIDLFTVDQANPNGGLLATRGATTSQLFASYYMRAAAKWSRLDKIPAPAPDLSSLPVEHITSLCSEYIFAESTTFGGQPVTLLVSDAGGGLSLTVRPNAPPHVYPPFLDVTTLAGYPGFVAGADFCEGGALGRFVCAWTDTGSIQFSRWVFDGTFPGKWSPFTDVTKTQAGNPGRVAQASVSFFNGAFNDPNEQRVHLVVRTETGLLKHTMVSTDGTFTPFEDVKVPGPIASIGTDVRAWNVP